MTTDGPRSTNELGSNATVARDVRRREFVAAGAGIGATLLAGCAGDTGVTPSGDSDGSDGSDGSDDEGSGTAAGRFRLLISDAPADIDDFERLDVTVESARIFEAREEEDEADTDGEAEDEEDTDGEAEDDEERDEDEDGSGNETADDDGDAPVDGDDDAADDDDESEDDDPGDDDESEDEDSEDDDEDGDDDDESEDEDSEGGFTVIDLGGVTVDLTQVLEADAMPVFDGELAEGRYEKLELNVASAAGIVDGEAVAVKLPSEKLQITKPFEVRADETVSFVFDINVVKRGPNNGYILKPVISGSGVAGRDVEVNEVGDERDEDDEGDDDETDDGDDESVADGDDESVADGDDDGPDETDDTGGGTNVTDGDDGSETGS